MKSRDLLSPPEGLYKRRTKNPKACFFPPPLFLFRQSPLFENTLPVHPHFCQLNSGNFSCFLRTFAEMLRQFCGGARTEAAAFPHFAILPLLSSSSGLFLCSAFAARPPPPINGGGGGETRTFARGKFCCLTPDFHRSRAKKRTGRNADSCKKGFLPRKKG